LQQKSAVPGQFVHDVILAINERVVSKSILKKDEALLGVRWKSRTQTIQQRFGFPQIVRVEAFREPVVDRRQKRQSFV
jgi:hypothetical protein